MRSPVTDWTLRDRTGTLPRLALLMTGLMLFGLAMAMSLQSNLGASSWTVFHHGISKQTPLTVGAAGIVVSITILVVAWLMGIKPGLGTLANILLIGLWTDLFVFTIPKMEAYPARVVVLVGSAVLLGFATAMYIKAGFGAGPRDGLMLAFTRRFNIRLGFVRWGIEIAVVIVGIALGGAFGIGTILFAIIVAPSVDIFFRLFGINTRPAKRTVSDGSPVSAD